MNRPVGRSGSHRWGPGLDRGSPSPSRTPGPVCRGSAGVPFSRPGEWGPGSEYRQPEVSVNLPFSDQRNERHRGGRLRRGLGLPAAATLALFGGFGGALVLAGSAGADPAPVCAGTTCTVTYDYTGAAQNWTVPAGVTQASVTLDGASGGTGASSDFPPSAPAGEGAQLVATIPVTPGANFQVTVGGAAPGAGDEAGGFNGGGQAASDSMGSGFYLGGGGGGASDLRQSPDTLAARVLVAGGGGGGGWRVQLRRGHLLRLHRRHPPQPTGGGHHLDL
jgi:Glycine rich protein